LFKCPANLIWNDDFKTCSRGRSTGRSINRKKIQQTLPKITEQQFSLFVTTTSTPATYETTAKIILQNQESSIDQYGQQNSVQIGEQQISEQTPSYEYQQIFNNQVLESQNYQSFSTTTMPTTIESTTIETPLLATFDLNDSNIISYYKDNLELKQAPPAPVEEVYNQESLVEQIISNSENLPQESVNNYEEYQSATIPTLKTETKTATHSQLVELSNYMQAPSASIESYYTQNIETATSTEAPVETSTQFLIEQSNGMDEDNYKIIQYFINNPRPLEQVNQYSQSNDMLQVNSPVEQEVIKSYDSYNQNLEQVEVDTKVENFEQKTDQIVSYSDNNGTSVEDNQIIISVKQDLLPSNKYSQSVEEIQDLNVQQEIPIVKQFDEYEQKDETRVDLNNKEADQTALYSSDEYNKQKVEDSVQQEISASDQAVLFNSNEYVQDLSDKQQLPGQNHQNQVPITSTTTTYVNKFNEQKIIPNLVNIPQPTINVVQNLQVPQSEAIPAYNSNLRATTMVPQTSTIQLKLATVSPIVESSNDYEIIGYYRNNEQLPKVTTKVTTPSNLGTIIKSNFKLDYDSHRNLQRKIESQQPLVSSTKASEIVPAKIVGTFNPSLDISGQQKDVLNRISKVLVNNTPNTSSNIQIDNNSAEFIIKNPFVQVSGVPNNMSSTTSDLNSAKGLKILFTILF